MLVVEWQKGIQPVTKVLLQMAVLGHCWLGVRKGIRPVKHWLLVVMICLELSTSYSSSCHHHLHHP